jgi:hypothetical protein
MKRLIEMIGRAYDLSMQAQDNKVDLTLAEEVSGECAEFLAIWDEDWGAYDSMDSVDQELWRMITQIKRGALP